ncbi:PepSY domain-containing protein [Colwellia demingiae]|uniref:PepSY domain-containing protein n=1 Tax=Colwellia demingiae TaxID=89401 RepID=A0A5C6QBE2_9GAMM|nr:PepSY-associated TM helix domain-containing protein [Colwellia demingiae]TWX66335.1 PepSY domain-containing protein [Colwellia demingiae]
MKDNFRQSMKWFHTWVGLIVGWILFFMFLTGTLGYFYQEITRWMEPERPFIEHNISNEQLINIAQTYLKKNAQDVDEWDIDLPTARNQNLRVGWRHPPEAGKKRGRYESSVVDIATGEKVESRATGGGRLLYRMHYRLHYLSTKISYWIVGFCSMLMLLAVITGVVIHKKIFTDFFTFRAKKGLPGWLDIHNVLSVIALPFHFMITYSGLLFFLFTYMALSTNLQTNEDEYREMRKEIYPRTPHAQSTNQPAKMIDISVLYQQAKNSWQADELSTIEVFAANDSNAQVRFVRHETDITYNPNDEVLVNAITGEMITHTPREYTAAGIIHNGFFSLHEGQFAGPIARWIYFFTGLIGTAMIASGLILWTTKRKPQQMKKPNGPDFGYRLVEQLNIGTIVGLPIAIAMYFYANRLLPIDMADRVNWEANVMFISWALLLVYPAFRPANKAWHEQLQLAALVYIALPLVNILTTDKHLINSLLQQDWGLAAFDLTLLGVGCCFAFSAYKYKALTVDKKTSRQRVKQDKSVGNEKLLQLQRVSKGNG